MSISLDSTSSVNQGSGPTNWSWTHTPVAAIDAVLIVMTNSWSGGITISAVTYGGVACGLVDRQEGAAGDEGTVYCYFKSGGLPTGAQTIAVTDGTNTAKLGTAWGLLAPLGAEIVAQTKQDFGVGSNPSFTLTCPASRDCFIGGVLSSGANTVSETPATGQTAVLALDHGFISAYSSRKTNIHTGGNTTFGYTGGSFSHIMVAAAVAEIQAVYTPKAVVT